MSQRISRCIQCGRAQGAHEAHCSLATRAPDAPPPNAAPAPNLASAAPGAPAPNLASAAPGAPAPSVVPVQGDLRALIGRVIDGRYRPTAVLGEGGMGTVYEADHLLMGRTVALKVLHPLFAHDPETVQRFRHEARAAGSIGHPNICEIYDAGQLDDGSPYLVMKRLRGETLADRIERETALPLVEVVDLALQVLSALAAAHEEGIVHRDIKPDNIFLAERVGFAPLVKLLDFGISKNAAHDDLRLTRAGMVMGTPYYMAPEQARGEAVDARIDLYAVGAVLYESLTGRRPFDSDELAELLRLVLFEAPRPMRALRPSLPGPVELVVARALAKDRAARFQTAREFMAALAALRVEVAAFRPNPSELDRLASQVRHDAQAAPPRPTGSWPSSSVADRRARSLLSDEKTNHGLGPAAPRRPSAPASPAPASPAPASPAPASPASPAPASPAPASPAPASPARPSTSPPPRAIDASIAPRRPTSAPARAPSTLPPPTPLQAAPPRLPAAPSLPRALSSIPPAPAPRPAGAAPTPQRGGPQIVVLPPRVPLTSSLPPLAGPASPYRPQPAFLPPPASRPPTPRGRPRDDTPNPLDAGSVSLPKFSALGTPASTPAARPASNAPPRRPSPASSVPPPPPPRGPLPTEPARPQQGSTPRTPTVSFEKLARSFARPNDWHDRWPPNDDDMPTRIYNSEHEKKPDDWGKAPKRGA